MARPAFLVEDGAGRPDRRKRSLGIAPPQPSQPSTEFDRAASRLFAASRATVRTLDAKLMADDYRIVAVTLERFAGQYRLTAHDAQDVVAGVLADTIGTVSRAGADKLRQPGAFLFWKTRNRVLDRLRQANQHPTEPLDNESLERGHRWYSEDDTAIVRLLEREASTELIDAAMRAALAANDDQVARVVAVWLGLAEELGREPTSREVAHIAETSHTAVRNALQRFKGYLPPRVQ